MVQLYGAGHDIYAQRIDSIGDVQWTWDGVAICTATGNQRCPELTSDGAEGAIITWDDRRTGNADIYAQMIDSTGSVQWTADGVAVCTATESQWFPRLTSDSAGGAIITWSDSRGGAGIDIYAMRVCQDCCMPISGVRDIPITYHLTQNFPNPFRPYTKITYTLMQPSHVTVEIYDCLGRLVRILVDNRCEAGQHEEIWDGRNDSGRIVASGIYFYRFTAGSFTESKKMLLLR